MDILHGLEPEAVEARKHMQFTRRLFHTNGGNEFWCMDQHDKMQRYGLRYHVGLEPTSGKVLWLKVWWTNSNPRIVLKYYLDVVRELGCQYIVFLFSILRSYKIIEQTFRRTQ